MTIIEMLEELADQLGEIAGNRRAQFGVRNRPLLGLQILPERLVEQNEYTEEEVSYRTVVAADGTRYSPAQKRGNAISGTVSVKLSESDIATDLIAQEYDAIMRLLRNGKDMEAQAKYIRFMDRINRGLVEKNEVRVWQALVDALVIREGDGGKEEVPQINPPGHRVTAALPWEDAGSDSVVDIVGVASVLQKKGYKVGRIVTSSAMQARARANAKTKEYIDAPLVTNDQLDLLLNQFGLPSLTIYDDSYEIQKKGEGRQRLRFLREDAMVFIAETGREEEIDLGDEVLLVENTLGYTGVGVAAGQAEPGRVLHSAHFSDKPPRVNGQGLQTSGPVVKDPEAVAVLFLPAAEEEEEA